MQRLSAWFYLKNNKKRAMILVLSFGLYMTLLYSVQFFLYPSVYMDEVIQVQGAKRMQVAYVNGLEKINQAMELGMDMSLWEPQREATYEELVEEINKGTNKLKQILEEEGTAEHVFICNSYGINVSSFGGDGYYHAPLLTKKELNTFVEYLNLNISEGNLPQKPGEFLMDERMAKNLGISVGDTIYDENSTLAGIVKYDTYVAAGIDFEGTQYPKRHIFFLNDGAITDLKAYFETFGVDADVESIHTVEIYSDKANAIKRVERFEKELSTPINIMTYSIAFVLGLTLFFVYRLHVQDRYSEWCLYRSLGYSEKAIYSLAFREYGICMVMSVGLAVTLTMVLCFIGAFFMRSKGMFYEYLLPEVLLQILGMITLLTGIMQIPVVSAMQRVKTIDAMEEE